MAVLTSPRHTVASCVYLVRHGRTALNAAGLLRGRLDPPLDDIGEDEARKLATHLACLGIGSVVSSPLRRARQTAEAIARAAGIAVAVDDGLADRDYGRWSGSSPVQLADRFGSIDMAPGVEPVDDVLARALAVFERAVAGSTGAAPVLVAHDAVNRLLLASLDARLAGSEPIEQPTGCFNVVERRESAWSVVDVGVVPPDRAATR